MSSPLTIQLNGHSHTVPTLTSPAALDRLVLALELKSDRIAIEHNGEIAPRAMWAGIQVSTGDRLEIVHFVGGGSFNSHLKY